MNADRRVLIVEARFYEDIADQLVEGATAVLHEANVRSSRISVPGVFENSRRDPTGPAFDGCR